MRSIRTTSKFKKDLKRMKRRGLDISLLREVVKQLAAGKSLPAKNRDHPLEGEYSGKRECHIAPDWLLIYSVKENNLILILMRTGTHSDLF